MYLIVGLGNPDTQYRNTYHNTGFTVVEEFCRSMGFVFIKQKCKALVAEGVFNGEKIIVAKPVTYMNNSGISVQEFVQKFKIPLSNILVTYDDLDLKKGSLRIRKEGSAGTHNGMKSIVAMLGTTQFPRIRIGIGKSENPKMDIADYVLSEIDDTSKEVLEKAITSATNAIKDFISGIDLEMVAQKYNRTPEN
ncbi:MAG: aminoacyl-tRNA hydrolase [Clostridia bacterium]|jgi:PTH1 family peptidyl-tRNA hydrolase|nr:aminoacyl-tRNA hydrolase [Clostridia bacterium]